MRVLYITHRVPYPPDKGDRIRNWHVLRQLTEFAQVTLAAPADEPVPAATRKALNEHCEDVILVPVSNLHRRIHALTSALSGRSLSEGAFMSNELRSEIERRQKARSFDAAIISASSLAPYLRTPAMSGVPAFVDVVDVDSQKWFDFARAVRGPKRWLYRFEGHRLRKVERDLPNWAHTITLVSDAETRAFDEIAGRSCAVTATNGVDLEYFSCRSGRGFARPDGNRVRRLESPSNPDCDAPSGLVAKPSRPDLQPIAFVGALDYLPNIDAAAWFVREVWPQIRKTHPAAAFRVIGRNPTREATSLDGVAGVEVVGSVPDVRPHLAEASVVVVPMRLGRGLQNKVLEALAMGKATVVSPPALAALKAVPGRDLMKAESPREWIDAVTGLLNDESKSGTLGANGRRFVEQHHDWEQCLRPLTDRIRALDPAECVA